MVDTKSPIKTRKAISTAEIYPLWPPFFSAKKVPHWSRAVYAFFSQNIRRFFWLRSSERCSVQIIVTAKGERKTARSFILQLLWPYRCYYVCSPEKLCDFFLEICAGIWHSNLAGIFGEFAVVTIRKQINNVRTRCIAKGEAQKRTLFGRFSGGFWFSQDRLFSWNSTRKPLKLVKSPIFTKTPL